MRRFVLVEAGTEELERLRPRLEAAGHAVEHVRTPEDAIALAQRETLVRVDRVESLAALAAGIAHDLNNVLASGLMATSMLSESVLDEGTSLLLRSLEESLRHATDLGRQLLWFAHGAEAGGETLFQPKHLVTELRKLVAALLPPGCEIETSYPAELRLLAADPLEVYQLLLGLLRTGWSALPATGGMLTLTVEDVDLDQALGRSMAGARPGPYVAFEVMPAPADGLPEGLRALLSSLDGCTGPAAPGGGLRVYLPALASAAAAAAARELR